MFFVLYYVWGGGYIKMGQVKGTIVRKDVTSYSIYQTERRFRRLVAIRQNLCLSGIL